MSFKFKSILGALGTRRKYTLDSTGPCTHTHSQLRVSNPHTRIFLRGRRKPKNKEKTNTDINILFNEIDLKAISVKAINHRNCTHACGINSSLLQL